jgi:hypothetical protein
MKSYNLPSIEQIASYHQGTLSVKDKQWMESIMQKNPFVKEAVSTFSMEQVQTVQQISERVSTRILNQYAAPRGFWSKYGVWIGLSAIVIMLSFGYFTSTKNEQRYFLTGNDEAFSILTIEGESTDAQITENTSIKTTEQPKVLSMDPASSPKEEELVAATVMDNERAAETTFTTPDKTEKEDEERINLSGKLLKNIRGISVVEVNKRGLKNREIPSFPGGNIALTNHFQSFITPVELQYGEPLYDAKAKILLEIAANGQLSDHDVQGHLHELHVQQIATAIAKLPAFKPGKGAVNITIEVKFN